MKKIALFLASFALWVLLAWPCTNQDVVAGICVAIVVTLVMRQPASLNPLLLLNPVRLFWLIAYTVVLAYYIVKANFDVAYRVLHPAMPISPGIVKVRTTLRTPVAITALSNSITLTPGTLTVNASEDGVLYVHWINIQATDEASASEHIVKRFEWFLKRIFE